MRALIRLLGVLFAAAVVGASPPAMDGPIAIHAQKHYAGPVVIADKTIVCTEPGQTGLYAEFETAPAIAETSIVIRNVTIKPGCANGIHLINAWNAIVDPVNIYGGYGDDTLQNGIIVQGQSHDVRISKATVMHAITGVYIVESAEGTSIDYSTFLGVIHGIFAHSQYAGRPWLNIGNSHIAASRAGIVAINRKQVLIHDSLIYRHLRGYRPEWSWEALNFANVTEATVRDVIVDCKPNAGATYPGLARALVAMPQPERVQMLVKGC